MKIYNEFWISLVLWKWNWIGISNEIEYPDWQEKRSFGWKKLDKINDVYLRISLYKKVFIFSKKDWIKSQSKDKISVKFIIWFSN